MKGSVMTVTPKIIVLASGTATGGGSGFRKLIEDQTAHPGLSYKVAGVACNHVNGGVRRIAG